MTDTSKTPDRIYIHHADHITADGTQALVFTSPAPVNFTDSQTEYVRAGTRPAPSVTVKPLEWSIQNFDNGLEGGYDQMCADTPFGTLCITDHRKFQGTYAGFTFGYGAMSHSDAERFSAEADAILGANADYERRILSAIQPTEASNARAEALLSSLKEMHEFFRGDPAGDDYDAFKVLDRAKSLIDTPAPPALTVSVLTMKLSGNREEYYVRIACGGRTIETRCYLQGYKNRAEYEADELRHVLLNEPKPDLLDPKYADDPDALRALSEGEQ